MTTIKDELIGSWQLLSYIEISIEKTESFFPLGKKPKGILIYSVDGYMSVHISSDDDPDNTDESLFFDSERYVDIHHHSYLVLNGSYHVDNRNAVVNHSVISSITPGLEGKEIERNATFEGDILYLKSIKPVLSNGRMVNSYMTWERMEKAEFSSRRDKFLELTAKRANIEQ